MMSGEGIEMYAHNRNFIFDVYRQQQAEPEAGSANRSFPTQATVQLFFTDTLIRLSSLSRKASSVLRGLRLSQTTIKPALILQLSNLILSRCGALVSVNETSLNQEARASED
ncbi:hypothetical protein [Gimesia panareensis]|uniref:hypothetical protein n=1 Tax=Gimesia panareensis TaxID=2527978 RepID=UPI0011A843AC|nr:hypothetical protein [Gimesia panareensis]